MDTESTPLDLSVPSARKRRNQLPAKKTNGDKTSSSLSAGCQIPRSRHVPETSEVRPGATGHPRLVEKNVPRREFESLASSSCSFDGEPARPTKLPKGPARKCRKRPNTFDMVCRVCGDRAFGYNFDVISCESCKAFFRRNALRAQPLDCVTTGDCRINIFTRRFCPACRLKKCFLMGMNPDLILESTRQKAREEYLTKPVSKGKSDSSSLQLRPFSHCLDQHQNRLFGFTHSRDDGFDALRADIVPSHTGLMVCPRTVLSIPEVHQPLLPTTPFSHVSMITTHPLYNQSPHSHFQLILPTFFPQQACLQDFHHVPNELFSSDPRMYWQVSSEETTLLTHLTEAYKDTLMTLPERGVVDGVREKQGQDGQGGQGGQGWVGVGSGVDSVFVGGSLEKNVDEALFSFAAKLGDFGQLESEDRVTLLRASTLPTHLLRWTACSEDNIRLPRSGEYEYVYKHEDEANAATGFRLGGDESPIMQEMMMTMIWFCRSLKSLVKNDVVLYALLHCLVLFEARTLSLRDRQAVSVIQEKYALLLKHYVESEYSFLHAEYYLTALRDKLAELRCFGEKSCWGLCGNV